MTTDRLFKIDLPIAVGLFDPAFDDTVFIAEAIHTHFTLNGWRDPPEFPVVYISSVPLDPADAFPGQIRLYRFINGIEDLEFVFFKRSTRIAVFTTTSFTFKQVAHKLTLNNQ